MILKKQEKKKLFCFNVLLVVLVGSSAENRFALFRFLCILNEIKHVGLTFTEDLFEALMNGNMHIFFITFKAFVKFSNL